MFFFFKQKTAYEMRISDWSSDVFSSDLSVAYSRSPREIPLLRRKVEKCIARAGFAPASHDGKALLHILEGYPRDELFQISDDELFDIALGILHLQIGRASCRERVCQYV